MHSLEKPSASPHPSGDELSRGQIALRCDRTVNRPGQSRAPRPYRWASRAGSLPGRRGGGSSWRWRAPRSRRTRVPPPGPASCRRTGQLRPRVASTAKSAAAAAMTRQNPNPSVACSCARVKRRRSHCAARTTPGKAANPSAASHHCTPSPKPTATQIKAPAPASRARVPTGPMRRPDRIVRDVTLGTMSSSSDSVVFNSWFCQISGRREEPGEALPLTLTLCRLHLCDQ